MFKIVSTTCLAMLLTTALVAWGMSPNGAFAQGHHQHGASGGMPVGGHAGHQSSPMSPGLPAARPANQPGAAGLGPMYLGSASSEPERPKAATDVIKWPKLLQEPAFASQRGQIEAPYRRSSPDLSAPTASDYRNMVKTVEEMKAILEWFPTKGVDTHDYEQAKGFLTKLSLEAHKRSEIASRVTPANAQAVVASKPKLQVAIVALDRSDQAGIERQQVCPVTGAKLGSMGDPIKVLVGDHPVYLCCAGCVAKVRETPGKYAAQ
ncbi:MAG: hypothetical protein ACYC35_03300 [Pirellulales bacterium]